MTWTRYIDTQPEEGKRFLGVNVSNPNWKYNCMANGWFRDVIYICKIENGKIQICNPDGSYMTIIGEFSPNYWMPMPQIPKIDEYTEIQEQLDKVKSMYTSRSLIQPAIEETMKLLKMLSEFMVSKGMR